jgi:Fe-S-cluster containining protein
MTAILMTKKGTKASCRRGDCQSACRNKPGWFAPGEAERAAAFLKLTLRRFFRQYLAVDRWVDTEDILLLSPAVRGNPTGSRFPSDPRGQCVFFQEADGACAIHLVKPMECRELFHPYREGLHRDVAQLWDDPKHQCAVTRLLGEEE